MIMDASSRDVPVIVTPLSDDVYVNSSGLISSNHFAYKVILPNDSE